MELGLVLRSTFGVSWVNPEAWHLPPSWQSWVSEKPAVRVSECILSSLLLSISALALLVACVAFERKDVH